MSGSQAALWAVADGDDPSGTPAGAGRVLGTYLRQLRVSGKLRLVDVVATGVVGSPATLSRIENAATPLNEDTVLALASLYGVTDPKVLQAMRALIARSREEEWWGDFRDAVPGWMERLISMEAASRAIRTYESQYVPGLLQSAEYARALMRHAFVSASRSGPPTDDEVERKVEVRLIRQRLLQQRQSPQLYALLDEAVLARPVGGTAVMRSQLRDLFKLEENDPRVHIRILRFDAGDEAMAPASSITHLSFPAGREQDMVYLEARNGGTYVTADKEVERYKVTLTNLWQSATTRSQTLELLNDYIEKLPR